MKKFIVLMVGCGWIWGAGGIAQEYRVIRDGGYERRFEVALDELSVGGLTGKRDQRKVSTVRTVEEIRQRAEQIRQTTGQEVELVLYEAGAARNLTTRRILTKKVLVRGEPGSDLRAVALAAGVAVPSEVDYAPGLYLFETEKTGGALDLADCLRGQPGVMEADALLARQQQKKWTPNDTLFTNQWHLVNRGQGGGTAGIDVNVTNVWDTYRGTNILIGIVDDGLEILHTDLWQNVNTTLDWDWNGNDADPTPNAANEDYHGTSCAGVAAGRGNNGRGISGAAPEATLIGYRLIAGETDDAMEAAALTTNNAVVQLKSNSWGPSDDGMRLEGPGALTLAAISNAATTGRGGRGTILVWAGGNGLESIDDSNYDGYANSIYTIAVAAVTDGGVQSYYSEPGANLVVTAPSSGGATDIATTDLMGNFGYNTNGVSGELKDRNYTQTFGGTSSATPLVSGIIALMLQANPNLGWRDVQEILIQSATQNASADSDWSTNSAGFTFNHKYGAGLVNARAAVTMAETWTNLGPQVRVSLVQTNLNQAIPDNNVNGITQSFVLVSTHLRVEHVTVTLDATHMFRGDLAVTLTSPSGMQSRLAEQHNDDNVNYPAWTFSSVRHWGEEAQGTWTLKVADLGAGDTGTQRWARVEFFGSALEVPAITNWTAPSGGAGMSIQISTTAGITNALQYTTNLAVLAPDWFTVDWETGTGGLVTLEDADSIGIQRFYRVVKP